MMPGVIRGLLLVSVLVGLWQIGQVAFFQAKALVAEQLIARAWQQTLNGATQVRPWPWADTWPVAEISVPRLGIQQIILSGDSGRVLAFGPGHAEQSVQPGAAGLTMISAHRDTHFQFLQDLKAGDGILIKTPEGVARYDVKEFAIVDQREYQIDAQYIYDQSQAGESRLLLVTCYPFDALRAGGDQRYLVLAEQFIQLLPRTKLNG